jgi:hypothetical protein
MAKYVITRFYDPKVNNGLANIEIREGDLIKAQHTCGGIKKGKIYTVIDTTQFNCFSIKAHLEDGIDYCNCYDTWTFIAHVKSLEDEAIDELCRDESLKNPVDNQQKEENMAQTYYSADTKSFPNFKTETIKIEAGDTVIYGPGRIEGNCCSCEYGKEYIVKNKPGSTSLGIGENETNLCSCTSSWTLIKKRNTFIMNLTQGFKNIFKGEPAKTFVKAGVTTENGDFTSEGREIFLQYLLQTHGDAFKKDIVDEIVKEQKAEKN